LRGKPGARNEAGGPDGLAAWEEALALYEKREFRAAGEIFNAIAAQNEKDGVAWLYINRCKEYIAAPPPNDWDGVNNLSQK
jgi:adenylate cyclase